MRVTEITGWKIGGNPKRATIKKKPEKFEPSIHDKLAARRKAAAKGDKDAWKSKKELPEQQINEIAPAVYAAVMWLLRWAAMRGAWPVLKWLVKRHGGKIIAGGAAAYYIDQGWDWVISIVGEEAAQMLIDNKFTIAMAVALILGAVALQKFFMKKGDELVAKYSESINESTSAGDVAAVSAPVGNLIKRGKYGAPEAPQKKDKNGTVVNALDQTTNLLGTKKKR